MATREELLQRIAIDPNVCFGKLSTGRRSCVEVGGVELPFVVVVVLEPIQFPC